MWFLGTMLSTEAQCQDCPFWCQSAQKKATWRGGGHAKAGSADCCYRWVVLTCRRVTLLLSSFFSFAKPSNVLTWTQGSLRACTWRRSEFPLKWWAWGLGFLHENFSQFHQRLLPENAKLQSSLACPPPSRWAPFEHSSTKMSRLDVEPLSSSMCPGITTMCFTSKSHLNMFQSSAWGDVMLIAIAYSQDCSCTDTWLSAIPECKGRFRKKFATVISFTEPNWLRLPGDTDCSRYFGSVLRPQFCCVMVPVATTKVPFLASNTQWGSNCWVRFVWSLVSRPFLS